MKKQSIAALVAALVTFGLANTAMAQTTEPVITVNIPAVPLPGATINLNADGTSANNVPIDRPQIATLRGSGERTLEWTNVHSGIRDAVLTCRGANVRQVNDSSYRVEATGSTATCTLRFRVYLSILSRVWVPALRPRAMPDSDQLRRAAEALVNSCPNRAVMCQGLASGGREDWSGDTGLVMQRRAQCMQAVRDAGGVAYENPFTPLHGVENSYGRGAWLECYSEEEPPRCGLASVPGRPRCFQVTCDDRSTIGEEVCFPEDESYQDEVREWRVEDGGDGCQYNWRNGVRHGEPVTCPTPEGNDYELVVRPFYQHRRTANGLGLDLALRVDFADAPVILEGGATLGNMSSIFRDRPFGDGMTGGGFVHLTFKTGTLLELGLGFNYQELFGEWINGDDLSEFQTLTVPLLFDFRVDEKWGIWLEAWYQRAVDHSVGVTHRLGFGAGVWYNAADWFRLELGVRADPEPLGWR